METLGDNRDKQQQHSELYQNYQRLTDANDGFPNTQLRPRLFKVGFAMVLGSSLPIHVD